MLTWTLPPELEPLDAASRFFATFHRAAFAEGWMWVVGDGRRSMGWRCGCRRTPTAGTSA
jgi:hypothetical protein